MKHRALRSRASVLVRLIAPLLALGLLAACGQEERRLARPEGSAVWVAPGELQRLTADDREALRRGEVRELFLEVAGLEAGEGAVPALTARRDFGVDFQVSRAARFPVTLVARGTWPAGADPEVAAPALAGDLSRLRRRAEDAGLVVAGYHLDAALPDGEEALKRMGRTLDRTRRAMDEGLFLSLSVAPETLSTPGIGALVDGVDFLVAFLYGPRPDGGPGPGPERAWTLSTVDDGVERLRDLEAPFLLGIGTVGRLHRLDAEGAPVESTSVASLTRLLTHPALGPGRTAVLEVVDRQTYTFDVDRAATVGQWRLRRGEALRVARLSTYHLRQAAARAEAVAPLLHLGEVFDRLPREGEELSPDAASLAGAALGGSAVPELTVEVEPLGGTSRFRVTLANRGVQATEISFLDHNYVELRTLGRAAFDTVNQGEFRRFDLELDGRPVDSMRALRSADTLKLYVPLLEPGQEVRSGTISLRGAGGGSVLVVTGRFVLPSGDLLDLPERPWPAPEVPGAEER